MLFMNSAIPKAQQDSQKVERNDVNNVQQQQQQQQEEERDINQNPVSSTLQIKSTSVVRSSPESLDRQVVLRRIRHHKCKNKVKTAFQALILGTDSASGQAQDKWVELGDAFTCP